MNSVCHLEYRKGASNKFWTIERDGSSYITKWGRIGTNGQQLRKVFNNEDECWSEYNKMIAAKIGKGYVEV